MKVRLAFLLTVAAGLATWLFVYNSGFGYDALEYLVIGRSLREGHPFYTFVPSKSFALYYLVAGYLVLPFASTHAAVSTLITAIIGLICVGTYRVVLARFGSRPALAATLLVGVGAIFMELNYLEPTGFVYVCGLMAFAAVSVAGARERRWPWLAAGLWTGVGIAFKVVAALYAGALIAWMLVRAFTDTSTRRSTWLTNVVWLMAGVAAAVITPGVYFWLTGRLQPFIEWSFVFPVLQYPAHHDWVAKLYTKLLWVWVVVVGSAGLSLDSAVRRVIYRDPMIWLILALGVAGLVPLLKTQSSHYAFPGAAFLLLYSAVVFDRWMATRRSMTERPWRSVIAAAVAVCVVSGLIYRPDALARLATLRSYEQENRGRASLQVLVPHDRAAIFLTGGTELYWISGRYPNWPVLNTDVQTTYYVQHHSVDLLRALDDPTLQLVEFDPTTSRFDDARFLNYPANREFLDQVSCRLQTGFVRHNDWLPPYVLWMRKAASSPMTMGHDCAFGD